MLRWNGNRVHCNDLPMLDDQMPPLQTQMVLACNGKGPQTQCRDYYMSHCPRCNYPDEERKDAEPILVSQKPILEVSNQKNKFRNLWRAFFAATAVMLLGVVGLVYFYSLFHLWRICFFGGFITAFIMLVSLWISIRCPQCGLRWYWYAFSKDSKYLKIGNIRQCPRCDYPG